MARDRAWAALWLMVLAACLAGGCARTGLMPTAEALRAPLTVEEVEVATPDGVIRGMLAEVRLDDPRVRVDVGVTTSPPRTVLEYATERDATLAVNANFFHRVGGEMAPIGLVARDGAVVWPGREWEGRVDPAVVFLHDGRAKVLGEGQPNVRMDMVRSAVAGIGGSETEAVRGTVLVQAGRSLAATARVQPMVRHPRTAVGVDRSGRRLWLLVLDGRQPGWSIGATLAETAELLMARGAWDGVNLDGGGSSSFVFRSAGGAGDEAGGAGGAGGVGGEVRTNRPSDRDEPGAQGRFRPVPVHLVVMVEDPAARGGP